MKAPLPVLSSWRLFLAVLLEFFIRLGGWLGRLLGKDQEGVEMVLRGRILGGGRRWRVGRNVHFVGPCSRFRLGEGVCFFGNAYFNANGPAGFVEIGDDSHIDQFCVLYGQGGLMIGTDCAISSGVIIYSQTNADTMKDGTPISMQPTIYAPVNIGCGCWLGAGVRVLPGVTIGRGCHVGAGAVVTGDLPPMSVAVGMPARILKARSQ